VNLISVNGPLAGVRVVPHARFVCAAAGIAVLLLTAAAAPAEAQRRPKGVPPGLGKQQPPSTGSPSTPPSGSPSPVVDGASSSTRIRSFGSWLDDSSTLAPGETWLTLSAQRWASPVFDGVDLPVTDVSFGIAPRVHAFATLPVTRYGYPGTPRVRELGDLYVGAKIGLRSADTNRVGLSVSPALEIVGSDSMIDNGLPRVSLVVPVNLELPHTGGRVYGSAGFFTRGAWFVGAALERHLSSSFVATGAMSFMGSAKDTAVSEEFGLHNQRLDASGSVAWIAAPTVVLFAGVGRTLSAMDLDATRYAFSFGASLNVRRPGPRPPIAR
jgi:hypothetical protein